MNMHTKLNISSIAGVKGDIHEFFSLIEQNLDAFSKNLEDREQINACRIYIHQLNGLFEMLELKDIGIVNGKTEQVIIALIEKQINPDETVIDTIKQAAKSTLDYLDDLIEGAEENMLRLFPVYQDLVQLLGHEQVSVYDLFHPALTANPSFTTKQSNVAELKPQLLIKQARTEYQFGLLQWLKDTGNKEALGKMRHAIGLIEQLPGPSGQRTFWWVAGGFLDCLLQQQTEIDLSSRKLCGRIEKTLRHYTDDTVPDNLQFTRELLFQIARQPEADEENQQIADIRKAYALPSLTESDMLNLAVSASPRDYLQEIQITLSKINDNWQAFSAGEQSRLDSFINSMAQLNEPVLQMQCKPMQRLIAAISNAAETLQTRHDSIDAAAKRENLTMEIATALLHLESIVVNFNKRQDNLTELVDTLCNRLYALTVIDEETGETRESPDLPTFSDIENAEKTREIQRQAAAEILVDLQHIEKTLEHFFQNPSDQASVSALSTLTQEFEQISGVLNMLGLERADHLLELCHSLTQKFAAPDNAFNQSEQNLLVDGISSLNFFLEAYKNDAVDNQRILEQAIAVFDSAAKQIDKQKDSPIESLIKDLDMSDVGYELEPADTADAESVSEKESEPAVKVDKGIDAELLDIFLEEADEILAEIVENIRRCQSDNADIKALTAIRRGFHTLKGSSRMVNLEFFSDAAWLVEQTLNQWLNEKNQMTGDLINLLEFAHQAFGQWCTNLKNTGESEIDTQVLQQLINDLNAANMQDALQPGQDDAIDSVLTEITIGDITIDSDLFEIFVKESKQHMETLEKELDVLLKTHPAKISKPFTLAAHTLTSTSRALALTFIAELSGALEEWLSRLVENQMQLKDADTQLIQNGVHQLGDLLKKVYARQFPDEVDLQLVQFLCQEINKRLSEKSSPEKTIRSPEPINLSEYRLKKIPAYIQSAEPETPEKKPDESDDEALENISVELLHVFLEEAKDTMPKISEKIRAWRILPQNDEIRISLLRLLHTLKGSANMIGTGQLGEMIHAMESEVEEAFDQPVVPTYAIDKIEYEYDQLCEKIEWLQNKILKPELLEEEPEVTEEAGDTTRLPASGETGTSGMVQTVESPGVGIGAGEAVVQEITAQPGGTLRVNAELIDRLVNDSGEISIIRAKIETQLNHFKQSLQDLTESIDRLHGQLREIEIQAETQMQSHIAMQQNNDQAFDPLEFDRFTRFQELTRLMAESVDDVITVQKNLAGAHGAATEAVSQQALISRELQQELVRIRTIPFGTVSERYYRIARKIAAELDKKVDLSIQGEDVEIDRSVLEKISTSLEHILRNAIVHGIERPARRTKSGKPEAGQITISLQREGNEVIIAVSDDGIGLDLKKIHKKAIQLGLIQKQASLDDDQIAALIFSPGLTTHTEVTGTAGRGMGMDIVQNDISSLGGQITIETKKNKGTTFNLRLPLTLAVAQALMISAGNQIFAIPSSTIVHIRELDSDALQSAYENRQIEFNGRNYPFTHLLLLLHQFKSMDNPLSETTTHNPVLILQNSTSYLAIHVDALIGNQEVVVKNTGPQIMQAPGIEGATLTGEGVPVLILNPLKLLQREDVRHIMATPLAELIDMTAEQEDTSAVVLVVDDSLTVRKVTSRLLGREGYRVLIAKNGLEAVEMIEKNKPDVILADLEMPKMNGFELIETVRKNHDKAQMPIIVISSRTAEKHRKMAEQLGANAFIGKPYKEEELLERIRQYSAHL